MIYEGVYLMPFLEWIQCTGRRNTIGTSALGSSVPECRPNLQWTRNVLHFTKSFTNERQLNFIIRPCYYQLEYSYPYRIVVTISSPSLSTHTPYPINSQKPINVLVLIIQVMSASRHNPQVLLRPPILSSTCS